MARLGGRRRTIGCRSLAEGQGERAAHGHPAVDRTVLQVLGEEQRATLRLRGGDHEAVPPAQPVSAAYSPAALQERAVDWLWLPGEQSLHVVPRLVGREPWRELPGHVDVVLGQHLRARAPGLLAPELLEPRRRARLFGGMSVVAPVEQDVRINEGGCGHAPLRAWRNAARVAPA